MATSALGMPLNVDTVESWLNVGRARPVRTGVLLFDSADSSRPRLHSTTVPPPAFGMTLHVELWLNVGRRRLRLMARVS